MEGLRILIRVLFSFAAVLLILQFLFRIFAPGTEQTAAFFQALQIVQPVLDTVTGVLIYPVHLITSVLAGFLDEEIRAWFPITPAIMPIAAIVDALAATPVIGNTDVVRDWQTADLSLTYPGILDWRLLLSLPVLALVEKFLLWLVDQADQRRLRRLKAQRQAALHEAVVLDSTREEVKPAKDPNKDLLFRQMVRDLKTEISSLQSSVNLDPLTHLFNKGYFSRRLQKEMEKARQESKFLAVIMIDIDDFKQLNDKHGHPIGDTVLEQVALVVSQVTPAQGKSIACRYGGEELALILTDTSPEAATSMAEVVREQISLIRIPAIPKIQVTASIGVYTVRFVPANGSFELTGESFIAKADSQMYKAKRSGKNRVVASFLP